MRQPCWSVDLASRLFSSPLLLNCWLLPFRLQLNHRSAWRAVSEVLQLRQLLHSLEPQRTIAGRPGGGIAAGGAWDNAVQRLGLRCGVTAATQAPAAAT
jgi:hypothetical protein